MTKRIVLIVTVAGVLALNAGASLANEEEPGDIGTVECRAVQTTIQEAVAGGEFQSQGKLLSTVARAANEPLNAGTITEACHECIVAGFANKRQEPCGPDAVVCPCAEAFAQVQFDGACAGDSRLECIYLERSGEFYGADLWQVCSAPSARLDWVFATTEAWVPNPSVCSAGEDEQNITAVFEITDAEAEACVELIYERADALGVECVSFFP